MLDKPIVSLCIPTNGVSEWVFPVLDSIFNQNVKPELYEIVVTDNGKNPEFKKKMQVYEEIYSNILYMETNALPFLNEIESYRRANGIFIKFVNHRTMLVNGALQKIIDYAIKNKNEKPITYFSNGVLEISRMQHVYNSFDQFIRNLSYFSSWSTGMAIWKEDLEKLLEQTNNFNELFPHTTVLFKERDRRKYVIDNSIIMNEMPVGNIPKGTYDLFYAFGIEYPGIITDLLREKSISLETYRFVIDKNLGFLVSLYWTYCIRKCPCSYDLRGFQKIFSVFYTKHVFFIECVKHGIIRVATKLGLSGRQLYHGSSNG